MLRNILHPFLIVLLGIAVFFQSCTTDVDWESKFKNMTLDQAFALPIGEANITMNDILTRFDSVEYVGSNGSNIIVKYTDSLVWELDKVPPMGTPKLTFEVISVGSLPNVGGTVSASRDAILDLDINNGSYAGSRIDFIHADTATFEYMVEVEDLNLAPGALELTIAPTNGVMKWTNGADAILRFTPSVYNVLNTIHIPELLMYTPGNATGLPVSLQARLNTTGLNILPTSKIKITAQFKNIKPREMHGMLSPSLVLDSREKLLDLSPFTSLVPNNGCFKALEPQFDFTAYNVTGISIGLNMEKMEAYRSDDPNFPVIPALFGTSLSTYRVLERKKAVSDPSMVTKFTINHEQNNGQVHRFFQQERLPNMIRCQFTVRNARTEAQINQALDFVSVAPVVKSRLDIRIPMKFNVGSYYDLRDTIKNIDLDKVFETDYFETAMLAMKISNGLPLKTVMSVSLLDANMKAVPLNVLSDSIIKAPVLNADGSVNRSVAITPQIILMQIYKSQLADLRKVKHMAIRVKFETKENSAITFLKEDAFKLKLGAYVKGDAIIDLTK